MNDPVMLFERVVNNYYSIKSDPAGTLYAFHFPWSFAKGAKIRLMPPGKSEHIDCPITDCYKNLVRRNDWSIEFTKEVTE